MAEVGATRAIKAMAAEKDFMIVEIRQATAGIACAFIIFVTMDPGR